MPNGIFPKLLRIAMMALWCGLLMTGWVERATAQVGGGLRVLPTRVVFDGRTRSAQLTLINNGAKESTYRISFKNMRMLEDGKYEDIKEAKAGEQLAEDFIRFSPRQVTIKPGGSQTVRLLLRKKKDLAAGEYRSHLLFQAMPPADFGKDVEKLAKDNNKIRFQLIPILGMTIPVIVRHGKLSASVKIALPRMEASAAKGGRPMLSLQLQRSGDRSVFGDVSVTFKADKGGAPLEVGRVNGLAVYIPNASRTIQLTLTPPEGTVIKQGRLSIEYKKSKDRGGELLAETTLTIP